MITPVRFVHSLPPDLSLNEACLCEPVAVVLKGLRRLEAAWGKPGLRRCGIVGAGPIGHLAARILMLRGHRVTVFDRNPNRLSLLGGSQIETREALENLDAFDALIEATGDPDAPQRLLEGSAAGATVLLLGLPYGRREFSFETIVGFDKCVVGSVGSTAEDFREALATLPLIDTSAFLQRTMPLSHFRDAWQMSRSREFLKVVLACGGAPSIAAPRIEADTADQAARIVSNA